MGAGWQSSRAHDIACTRVRWCATVVCYPCNALRQRGLSLRPPAHSSAPAWRKPHSSSESSLTVAVRLPRLVVAAGRRREADEKNACGRVGRNPREAAPLQRSRRPSSCNDVRVAIAARDAAPRPSCPRRRCRTALWRRRRHFPLSMRPPPPRPTNSRRVVLGLGHCEGCEKKDRTEDASASAPCYTSRAHTAATATRVAFLMLGAAETCRKRRRCKARPPSGWRRPPRAAQRPVTTARRRDRARTGAVE